MTNLRNMKRLPSALDLVERYPLSLAGHQRVQRDRQEIQDILAGRDSRLLMIVGPCSAWPSEAVYDYAKKLVELRDEVDDVLKIVLRVYIQKPRTTKGWTGPINQPNPFQAPDIEAGMHYARELMVRVVELGLPVADEAVFTHNAAGFQELLAWVAIGARSTEDQEHRIWASAIDAPVGMKNPTSGCIPVGINSVMAAQHPHTAVFDGYQVETSGNPYAHLVLRGGAHGPNYALHNLYRTRNCIRERGIENPAVLIDASHENSRIDGEKRPDAQVDVVREVMSNLGIHRDLLDTVRGFLLESFLQEGSQALKDCTEETVDRSGLSVTDPCMGWERTRNLIRDVAVEYAEICQERRRAIGA